jgi:hypothetical protein
MDPQTITWAAEALAASAQLLFEGSAWSAALAACSLAALISVYRRAVRA